MLWWPGERFDKYSLKLDWKLAGRRQLRRVRRLPRPRQRLERRVHARARDPDRRHRRRGLHDRVDLQLQRPGRRRPRRRAQAARAVERLRDHRRGPAHPGVPQRRQDQRLHQHRPEPDDDPRLHRPAEPRRRRRRVLPQHPAPQARSGLERSARDRDGDGHARVRPGAARGLILGHRDRCRRRRPDLHLGPRRRRHVRDDGADGQSHLRDGAAVRAGRPRHRPGRGVGDPHAVGHGSAAAHADRGGGDGERQRARRAGADAGRVREPRLVHSRRHARLHGHAQRHGPVHRAGGAALRARSERDRDRAARQRNLGAAPAGPAAYGHCGVRAAEHHRSAARRCAGSTPRWASGR